jgi:hypothetical protein
MENKQTAVEDYSPRYIILEESCSGHCCFEYTVIDTHIEHDGTWKRSMCETFDKDKAETICNALNTQFKNEKQ